MHARDHFKLKTHRRSRAAFSLTELLVVIGIIVLLVGLLLVALQTVRKRALRTKTEATMGQFLNACSAFQTEHGFYPGVIPDDVLWAHESANGDTPISSSENALLHLMGGYRVLSPQDNGSGNAIEQDYVAYAGSELVLGVAPSQWRLKVNVARIGEGPVINGKPYQPYYTPGADELAVVDGQVGEGAVRIPDVIDGWGQPILYVRQSRNRGPLAFDAANANQMPQFRLTGLNSYTRSCGLGELSKSQVANFADGCDPGSNMRPSVLNVGSADQERQLWALIMSHQAFYKSNFPLTGTARGSFALISAGPDGVFFAATDGPGSPTSPINATGINTLLLNVGPRVLDEFDDVRIYGGG